MNWYKAAKLQNFQDRNIWNDRIDDLKKITVDVEKASKLVYQTGTVTRQTLKTILDSKRINPYPKIEELLKEAENLCLDSPHRVSDLCKTAVGELVKRVQILESERKDFIRRGLPGKTEYKGWFAND